MDSFCSYIFSSERLTGRNEKSCFEKKQSSVVVTVLIGWLIYKEKDILYKLMCTGIVLSGIFVALI